MTSTTLLSDVVLTESSGPEVARELALRDGLKAILQGDVAAVGSGYVLTASIVEAASYLWR